jgi:hypothetical protein
VEDIGFIQFLGNARNVTDITFSVLASKNKHSRDFNVRVAVLLRDFEDASETLSTTIASE